ncbi:MAG TPA: class I SAM-dependent methyltransferase [Phycisphaerae bacterium]|nr:class I SAM-dependent methyltransferase [Phycisphaerae bacterium]
MNEFPNKASQASDFEFTAMNEAKNYRQAILQDFTEHLRGDILEVGAGIGQITKELRRNSAITKLVSIEPDPRLSVRLRETFPDQTIIQGTIDDLKGNESWDAILSINVLEHIAEDERELAIYRQLLVHEKGVLCLFVPARPEIYAPLDRDFGHFRRYTKPELRRKLEQAGFKILRMRYYNFVGYFAWWLNFCVFKKKGFDPQAVRFFDRVIFPVVRGLESYACPPPIGQSLLATACAK